MANEQQSIPPAETPDVASPVSPHNGWRTFGILVITMAIALAVAYWLFTSYLFPSAFTPVELNVKEQQQLDQKLEQLSGKTPNAKREALVPEVYTETRASREIRFSEKELNALLANNTDLASRLAIDLSDNLASAKLLINLDPDFPVLGGNTLKVTAGMELSLAEGKPRAILKGVSLWGVPLPNAWLGNMKNTDLIQEFGESGGFWQAINDGVEIIEVKEGELFIQLKE